MGNSLRDEGTHLVLERLDNGGCGDVLNGGCLLLVLYNRLGGRLDIGLGLGLGGDEGDLRRGSVDVVEQSHCGVYR